MPNITYITVKHQFEATHNYPEAPEGVEFLANTHRHVFHVEVEIEVFNDDRELEFILVKQLLKAYCDVALANRHLGRCSCEQIAEIIQNQLKKSYPVPADLKVKLGERSRLVNVRVLEDNENGVYLKEVPFIEYWS